MTYRERAVIIGPSPELLWDKEVAWHLLHRSNDPLVPDLGFNVSLDELQTGLALVLAIGPFNLRPLQRSGLGLTRPCYRYRCEGKQN